MDLDWHSDWSFYLLEHDRDLALWQEYGTEYGILRAKADWAEFMFWKDAKELSVNERTIADKAEYEGGFIFIHGELRLHGVKRHEKYPAPRDVSRKELAAWSRAFEEAYGEYVEQKVDQFIPKKLQGKLDRFCDLVSWLSMEIAGGFQPKTAGRPFGIQLGAKKRKEPELHTVEVSDKTVADEARRHALQHAKNTWKAFVARQTDGSFLRYSMIGYRVHPDQMWKLTPEQDQMFEDISRDTVEQYWSKKLREFAPPSAWKNSFMICSLYEQIWLQGRKQKKEPDTMDRGGFWRLRSQERNEFGAQLRDWEEEEFAKWEKYGHAPPIVARWELRQKERRKAERAKQRAEAKKAKEPKLKAAGIRG